MSPTVWGLKVCFVTFWTAYITPVRLKAKERERLRVNLLFSWSWVQAAWVPIKDVWALGIIFMKNSLVRWRKGIETSQMFLLSGPNILSILYDSCYCCDFTLFLGGIWWRLGINVWCCSCCYIRSHHLIRNSSVCWDFLSEQSRTQPTAPQPHPHMAAPSPSRVTQYSVHPNTHHAFSSLSFCLLWIFTWK